MELEESNKKLELIREELRLLRGKRAAAYARIPADIANIIRDCDKNIGDVPLEVRRQKC